MKKILIAALLGVVAVCASAAAQETQWQRFNDRNVTMAALQPTWIGPLIQSDARLTQGARFSVARSSVPGTEIFSYGNNHGVSLIAGTRWQFDFNPPSFFRNHCAALPDGWGNASAQVKYRIASGNRDHGNFAVTAILFHGFASGAGQNGALTAYYVPKLAAGKAFGRFFDVQSTLSGVLPTGKIDQQGRAIEWNLTGQLHPASRLYFDIENNAAFNLGGPADGKAQNFITPAAFFIMRRNDWGPRHPVPVIDGGMQIATSQFHCDNHNLIVDLRILF